MRRVLWVVGEIVAGFLLGGLMAGTIVPVMVRSGVSLGPWVIWVTLLVALALAIVAGERLRRGSRRS